MPRSTKNYYAVNNGRQPGVYLTWDDCEAQVKGFVNARYKKFSNVEEAEAFVDIASGSSPTRRSQSPAKATPSATATPRRTSPYRTLEPVPNITQDSPRIHRASPSKRPTRIPSPSPIRSPTRVSPSRTAAKWSQRVASPDIRDESTWDVVYSDGACKRNGQIGSVAGIGVWWGINDPRNLAERCPGAQTNNRAELIAIARILETVPLSNRGLLIKTDSRYSMDCFKSWLPKWLTNGFTAASGNPVKNAPLIRYISALLDDRARNGHKVRLQHIKGHAGHEGNEGADDLAGRGAEMPEEMERDWKALTKALRAKESLQEIEVVDISDGDLEVYAECLVDDDQLLNDLDFYAGGLANDEEMLQDLAEA